MTDTGALESHDSAEHHPDHHDHPVRRLLGGALTAPLHVVRRVNDTIGSTSKSITDPGMLPVAYNFFSGIGPEIRNPGGSLPGANLWAEKPSASRPIPVILVHGTAGGGQTNWGTYVPLLKNAGYSVFTLTYGVMPGSPWPFSAIGGLTRMEESAAELAVFVDKVLDATGAPQVDIVGHSQGTLMPNYYARFLDGGPKIRKYISLAPLWLGTSAFGVDVARRLDLRLGIKPGDSIPCHSAAQMSFGSDFIAKMNAPIERVPGAIEHGPYVPGIEYTNISTSHDEFVVPFMSGQVEPGPDHDVTNIIVQTDCAKDFSDHLGICGSPRAAQMVLNALDPSSFAEVPHTFVRPFFG